jgi:uncharacterized protein with HEPN domain
MSRRDDRVSLRDMLSHAREAVELLGDSGREDLAGDRVMQLALTRLVEVVGEAANRTSPDTRQRHPDIPWPQIVGMRNRLIHGYDVVDLDLLWDTVTDDLPPLIGQLQSVIDDGA